MIVVQRLSTEWTPASRGGTAAAARAATPVALPLPALWGEPSELVYLHRVTFGERERCEPLPSVARAAIDRIRDVVPELHLRLEPAALHVRLFWTGANGAPARAPGRAIRLAEGAWCRLLHNGRTSTATEWVYQTTTINVAFCPSDADVFLISSPHEVCDTRASLW